jgi:hypothetical protein
LEGWSVFVHSSSALHGQKLRKFTVMLKERKPSGREKDAAAVALLAQLREKLHSGEISLARKAAFNLSWMQEDGLDILVEALFGSFPRDTKKAAAYGLRSMKGRMRKLAQEVLTKGLTHPNRITKDACAKSLQLMREGPAPRKPAFQKRFQRPRRPGVQEFRGRGPAGQPAKPGTAPN